MNIKTKDRKNFLRVISLYSIVITTWKNLLASFLSIMNNNIAVYRHFRLFHSLALG